MPRAAAYPGVMKPNDDAANEARARWEEAQREILFLYPEIGVAGSPENVAFVRAFRTHDGDWRKALEVVRAQCSQPPAPAELPTPADPFFGCEAPGPLDAGIFPFLQSLDHEFWGVEAEMVRLTSPLETIRAWCEAQPPIMQAVIARGVGRFLELDTYIFTADATDAEWIYALFAWLEQHADNAYLTLNRVHILRGAVDLGVLRNRATRDDWAFLSNESVDHLIAARQMGDATAAAICEKGLDELPGRACLWMLCAHSWRQLCHSALSEEALACWYEIATWQQD